MPDPTNAGSVDAATGRMLGTLEDLVMAETPSSDVDLVRAGAQLASGLIHGLLGDAPESVEVAGRPHLRLRGGSPNPVLLLCHLDTVWPAGTIERWPFLVHETRATGPGVFDMKAGLVQGLYALCEVACPGEVTLLITTDEEIGSPTSRELIEDEAKQAAAVLVLEPSAHGAFKTARKGISTYELTVHGRAAHPGLDPEHGVNAIVELAHQVTGVVDLADPAAETTVAPTMASAGTSRNTIPASATMTIDVRAWTAEEQHRVHDALVALRAHDPDARLSVAGAINRPPLERTHSRALAALADTCIAELGLRPAGEARAGGGSDGNFTAALGIPTLDGMGAVGNHAHAEGEYVDITYLAERTALIRAMIEKIVAARDERRDSPKAVT